MEKIPEEVEVWQENLDKLKEYYSEFKNFDVSKNWIKDKQLSRWVENIRSSPNELPAKLYNELKTLGFDFRFSSDWDSMYAKLESFYNKNGHSYVPSHQAEFEDLFDWTVNQRNAKSLLTEHQINKLNNLSFEWANLTFKEQKWEMMYQQLVSFKNDNGHVKVPQDYKENPPLGRWVSFQRRAKKIGGLAENRIQKLDSLGILWSEDIEKMWKDTWERHYNKLVNYKKANGHIDRIKIRNDDYQLGLWMESQIVGRAKKHISKYRIEKLNAIHFDWERGDFRSDRWNNFYQKLKQYKDKHGHCQVTKKEDFHLSVWLSRNKRDKEKISTEKRGKLEELGIKWAQELKKENWELKYGQLVEFKKIHGHLMVPRKFGGLHEWVQAQKTMKTEGKLKKERELKLIEIGFIWKGEIEKQKMTVWESMYTRFKLFKEKNGEKYHLKLTQYPDLHHWVGMQIRNKKKLSSNKKNKLDEINFQWKRSKYYWDERWESMFEELVAYKNKFGHCDVSQSQKEFKGLAHWVNGQRSNKIPDYRREKLNQIGFSWANEIKVNRWTGRVHEYLELKKLNKLYQIQHPSPLSSWIYQQKKNFDKLSEERKKILLEAGIISTNKTKV